MSLTESLEYRLHEKEHEVSKLRQELNLLKDQCHKKENYHESLLELLDELCFVLGYSISRLKDYDESLPEQSMAVLNAAKERLRQERGR